MLWAPGSSYSSAFGDNLILAESARIEVRDTVLGFITLKFLQFFLKQRVIARGIETSGSWRLQRVPGFLSRVVHMTETIFVAGDQCRFGSDTARALQAQNTPNCRLVARTHAEFDLHNQATVLDLFVTETPSEVYLAAPSVSLDGGLALTFQDFALNA
jgi:hypothetical protein